MVVHFTSRANVVGNNCRLQIQSTCVLALEALPGHYPGTTRIQSKRVSNFQLALQGLQCQQMAIGMGVCRIAILWYAKRTASANL